MPAFVLAAPASYLPDDTGVYLAQRYQQFVSFLRASSVVAKRHRCGRSRTRRWFPELPSTFDSLRAQITAQRELSENGSLAPELALPAAIEFFFSHVHELKLVVFSAKPGTSGCEGALPYRHVLDDGADIAEWTSYMNLRHSAIVDLANEAPSHTSYFLRGMAATELEGVYVLDASRGASATYFYPSDRNLRPPLLRLKTGDAAVAGEVIRGLQRQSQGLFGLVSPWNPYFWKDSNSLIFDNELTKVTTLTTNAASRHLSVTVPWSGLPAALAAHDLQFHVVDNLSCAPGARCE